MTCIILQHLRPQDPHLVHLAGELDEIAGHAVPDSRGYRTLENNPCKACPNSWNRVRTSSRRQQRCFTRCRMRDVQHVDHHRRRIEQEGLVDEVRHPGAAAFALARVVVAEKEPDRRAIRVEHLPDSHVRVIADQVCRGTNSIP